ncbi:MAG TPA: type II secretion system major pseudopilin GspG [Verrucomicrobiae bacterium]|nr:type II secretion system major pseudopilin GspG [Verrucomicrobiae bacterium]
MPANNERGFTLIELMVVIAILGLLGALVAPKLMGRSDDAKIQATKTQIQQIQSALKLYRLDNGVYPSTEQGLQALVSKPTTGVIPKNYKAEGYLESKSLPKDSWGNDYAYLSPGEHGEYDLYSLGADGAKGGEGKNADIESWNLQ